MRHNFTRPTPIAALDIGSSKICCALAQPLDDLGNLEVIGLGHHQSQGVKNGQIVNLAAASHAIAKAIHGAEHMARHSIQEVFVNISGKAFSLRPALEEKISGREIEEEDVTRLLEKIKQEHKAKWAHELLHSLPMYFQVDDTPNVVNPVGMFAESLVAKVHLISTTQNRAKNLVQTLDKAQVDTQHIVYTPYASGLGALLPDEMDLGAAVIDFGAGTTSFSVFKSGQCLYAASLPVGGLHITHDIAHALSTPIEQAERLKILHGAAVLTAADKKERLKISQFTPDHPEQAQTISKFDLNSIIHPRLEELFDLITNALAKQPEVQAAARRFVLTGGGSQLAGLKKYGTQRLDQQVRLGGPFGLLGLTETSGGPGFSVCSGLLHYGNLAIQSGQVKAAHSFLSRLAHWFKS